MQQNSKIAIISQNNYLEEALLFNANLKDCKTFTPNQECQHEEFDLIIGDSPHTNPDVKKAMKLFSIPIELQAVLKYITDQLEQKKKCRVSEQKRILYIDKKTIALTEQETEIMAQLLKNCSMQLSKKALTDVHAFDAIKSIVYRLNNKLMEHDAPISLRLTSQEILLKK